MKSTRPRSSAPATRTRRVSSRRTRRSPGEGGNLRTDEVVARWSGWSLAVPQPTFGPQADGSQPARLQGLPFTFGWKHQVKAGSLPRLRFARKYRMRARVADMAGGGLARDDPAADRCATDVVTYRRYEPIPSPEVTLPEGVDPATLGPGESVAKIVIRSDLDLTVAEFAAQHPEYTEQGLRLLWPPRASMALAEQHGKLDDGDDEATFELVTRAIAEPAEAGGPRLQDPAAGGITVFPVPEPGGVQARMTERAWKVPWPDPGPKTLQLAERQAGAASQVAFEGERLIVRLRPAEQVTLELSSFMTDDFSTTSPCGRCSRRPRVFRGQRRSARRPRRRPVTGATRC